METERLLPETFDFNQQLGDVLIAKSGGSTILQPVRKHLKGKTLLLYFGGQWNRECSKFEPKLIQMYKSYCGVRSSEQQLEVVFVSMDRDTNSFAEHYADMPWTTIPFGEAKRRLLKEEFRVDSLPRVVVVSSSGEVINHDAHQQVARDPRGRHFPWTPKRRGGYSAVVVLFMLASLLGLLFWVLFTDAIFVAANTE